MPRVYFCPIDGDGMCFPCSHIDAPYHFNQHGRTLDQIPIEDLIDVPGVMIDVYDKVHHYKGGKLSVLENYALTREDILAYVG